MFSLKKRISLIAFAGFLFGCSATTVSNNQDISGNLNTEEIVTSEPKKTVSFSYEPSTKPYDIDDQFPWSNRDALVIYAVDSWTSIPDKSFPSMIIHNYDYPEGGLIPDGAPHLTTLSSSQMISSIFYWLDKSELTGGSGAVTCIKVQTWVDDRIDDGWQYFIYMLEPSEYAGNAYPWAKHANKKY